MEKKSHWVMDYETLLNCFVAVFEHYKEDEIKIFVVSRLRNDIKELYKFLERNKANREYHISFNGLGFDSQITEFILNNKKSFIEGDPQYIANMIHEKANEIISSQERGEFLEFSEGKLSIPQIDVFKLNHWDNPAKRSSLKWIQYSMDWYNIQEMPIHHSSYIDKMKDLETIIGYCINDVRSTKQIYNLSKDLVGLRKALTEQYNLKLYSASEPRIAKEIFLELLCRDLKLPKYDVRQYRTNRSKIKVKDIILPYIKFRTPEFQSILENFNKLVIDPQNTKGGFKYSITHKKVRTDFGLGGVHGAKEAGEYAASEDMIIMTSDVTSFYPNLAIRNKWAPAHLSKDVFCQLYEWFFEERKKIPKKDPRNYVYKIILNSTYGLSNDRNSFLYDPEFTMKITINGQLSLMMLYEMLSTGIPESKPLMQNTDGLEMIIPRQYKEKYLEICKEWEDMTQLQLEHDEYQKLFLADVNNYIAVNNYKEVSKEVYEEVKSSSPHYLFKEESSKYFYAATKCKGRFEFHGLPLHKNKSYLVIRKAVYNYFVHSIAPTDYLEQNRNIYDYCAGVKIKGDWHFQSICYKNGKLIEQDLQNILRYYISDNGCKILKKHKTDNRVIQLESGNWLQTVFNTLEKKPWEEYHINLDYYMKEINKEIHNITISKNQLKLF
jgi:hypothetical protein